MLLAGCQGILPGQASQAPHGHDWDVSAADVKVAQLPSNMVLPKVYDWEVAPPGGWKAVPKPVVVHVWEETPIVIDWR